MDRQECESSFLSVQSRKPRLNHWKPALPCYSSVRVIHATVLLQLLLLLPAAELEPEPDDVWPFDWYPRT